MSEVLVQFGNILFGFWALGVLTLVAGILIGIVATLIYWTGEQVARLARLRNRR